MSELSWRAAPTEPGFYWIDDNSSIGFERIVVEIFGNATDGWWIGYGRDSEKYEPGRMRVWGPLVPPELTPRQ